MNDQANIRRVTLKYHTDLTSKPTISLVLLVKSKDDAALLLERAVAYVDEIVLITVDLNPENSLQLLDILDRTGTAYSHIAISKETHPGLYFDDVEAAYEDGTSLANERFGGLATNGEIIANWSSVRNMGWEDCSCDWILLLDATDNMTNLGYIASMCENLDAYRCEVGYMHCLNSAPVVRLVKKGVVVSWVGAANEMIEEGARIAFIEGEMTVSRTANKTILEKLETFNTLYVNARQHDWQISPRELLSMAKMAKAVGVISCLIGEPEFGTRSMVDFAKSAISAYLGTSLYTEERAWACALMGEILEGDKDYAGASNWYERSLAEHPGNKSAYRLAHSRFMEQKWQECLDAFDQGVENEAFVHLVDDGNETKDKTFIIVAAALEKLGRHEEARRAGQILLQLFPDNIIVRRLCDGLSQATTETPELSQLGNQT